MRIFSLPQWPKSEYKASAPVVHKNTAPNVQKPAVPAWWVVSNSQAYTGDNALKIDQSWAIQINPVKPNMENHNNMIGPKSFPTTFVPKIWKINNTDKMTITIGTVSVTNGVPSLWWSIFNPSIAEETEIGGVIIPSASKVAPPIMAGKVNHFAWRLTNAKRAKIPPSPLLSARKIKMTYFNVVCKVNVQKIQDNPPRTVKELIGLSPMIDCITYNGEVPMSP